MRDCVMCECVCKRVDLYEREREKKKCEWCVSECERVKEREKCVCVRLRERMREQRESHCVLANVKIKTSRNYHFLALQIF